jgi:hypothetical protein
VNVSGEIAIETKYYATERFSEGLAAVQVNERGFEKMAFIDTDGKIAFEGMYLTTGKFRKGLCLVQNEKKNGYINRSGLLVWSAPWVDIVVLDPLHLMP